MGPIDRPMVGAAPAPEGGALEKLLNSGRLNQSGPPQRGQGDLDEDKAADLLASLLGKVRTDGVVIQDDGDVVPFSELPRDVRTATRDMDFGGPPAAFRRSELDERELKLLDNLTRMGRQEQKERLEEVRRQRAAEEQGGGV